MKLESIENSKFGAFKEDVLKNPLKVSGGKEFGTTYQNGRRDIWRTLKGEDYIEGSKYRMGWGSMGEMRDASAQPGDDFPPGSYDFHMEGTDLTEHFDF